MAFNKALYELFEAGIASLCRQPAWDTITHDVIIEKTLSVVSNKNIETTFSVHCKGLRLNGLHSAYVAQSPAFDWVTKRFHGGIGIQNLTLHSDNVRRQSTYGILSHRKISVHNSPLDVQIKNIRIKLSGVLDIDFCSERYAISEVETIIDFERITWGEKAHPLLKMATPVFSPFIKKILSKQIKNTLIPEFHSRLQDIIARQQDIFEPITRACRVKRTQGGWPAGQCPLVLQGFGGVGQYPLPMLWTVPEVDSTLPHAPLENIMDDARTGDLLLFSGNIPSSERIKRFTQSPFSHVVLLVKEPEFENGRCLAWQATASEHRCVLRNMKPATGIQLNYLEDVINDYLEGAPGSTIVFRKLLQKDQRAELDEPTRETLIQYIRDMDGKPYTSDMDMLYLMGLLEVENPGHENYYCAGLVAESLMQLGILDTTFMQHQYTPRDFCQLQKSLPCINNFSYHECDFIIDT